MTMVPFDIVLPVQHFEARHQPAPEQRLMVAVLQDALDCVAKYRVADDAQGQRLFREANQWLLAAGTDWPYSFESICAVLDLDLDAVRQRVRVASAQPGRRAAADGAARPAQTRRSGAGDGRRGASPGKREAR